MGGLRGRVQQEFGDGGWAQDGQADLHVWAGGFHGLGALYPRVPVSAAARRTRTDWLGRVLSAVADLHTNEPVGSASSA